MKKGYKVLIFILCIVVSAFLCSSKDVFVLKSETVLLSSLISLLIYFFIVKFKVIKENVVKTYQVKNGKMRLMFFGVMSILTGFAFLYKVPLMFGVLVTIILIPLLFCFYVSFGNEKGRVSFSALSIIFSLLLVFGQSYDIYGNSSLVFSSLVNILLSVVRFFGFFYFFKVLLVNTYSYILSINVSDNVKGGKLVGWFRKNPFWFCVGVLFICYIPYMIIYYPVVINYDAANQIKEVMGIHTRYMDSVVLLNENVYITNFNPVLHTLLLGGLFKFGYNVGSVNFGLFLYSIVQVCVVIFTFSYVISYLKKSGISEKVCLFSLLLFAFVPVFPMYAMTSVKDVLFSCFVVLFVVKMYDFIKNEQRVKDYIYLGVIVLLMMLFRNNGLFIVLFTFPFLIVFLKGKRKGIVLVFISSVLIYQGYVNVLLPAFEISSTSIREALSVPFQQTARHAKYYGYEVSESDKKIIDKVLGFDTLASRYEPDLSDKVKNEFNKYTTNEELMDYFGVWFKYLLKRPGVYIDATINNVYGYFYPNVTSWYIYNTYNTKLEEAGFDYQFNNLNSLRSGVSAVGNAFPLVPVLGLFVNIGFTTWLLIFMFVCLLEKEKRKFICLLIPAFVIILNCVLGPANTYFRYILPITFSLPFLVPLFIKEVKNKNVRNGLAKTTKKWYSFNSKKVGNKNETNNK